MGSPYAPAPLEVAFRLPRPGWPRAVFRTGYAYHGGALVMGEVEIARADTRDQLERGIGGTLADGTPLALRLVGRELALELAGTPAPREDRLRPRPSRSAWGHAGLALVGSFAGFAASWLYLAKAADLDSAWSLAMGRHMAGWHAILTVALFPAAVWCQRPGIRVVQLVSLVFFGIHAGIAIANAGDPVVPRDAWIAALNAASGGLFLAAAVYGNTAYRDMDPLAALAPGSDPRAAAAPPAGDAAGSVRMTRALPPTPGLRSGACKPLHDVRTRESVSHERARDRP